MNRIRTCGSNGITTTTTTTVVNSSIHINANTNNKILANNNKRFNRRSNIF